MQYNIYMHVYACMDAHNSCMESQPTECWDTADKAYVSPLQIVPQHITRTTAEAQESHSTAEHHPGHVRLNLRMISAPGGMLRSCINHGTSHVDPT